MLKYLNVNLNNVIARHARSTLSCWHLAIMPGRNGAAQLHTFQCHRWGLRLSLSKSPHRRKWHSFRCSIRYNMDCVKRLHKNVGGTKEYEEKSAHVPVNSEQQTIYESENVDGAHVVRIYLYIILPFCAYRCRWQRLNGPQGHKIVSSSFSSFIRHSDLGLSFCRKR